MKLNYQSTKVRGSGVIQQQSFGISDPVFIFKILSEMYSDPVMAVIREYICNAIDSHTAAGKPDVPVTVISPTILHPYFEVIDEGVGLSHEQVCELFSTYGASNKRDSNSQIGGFGIGSKSAYAYSETFSITSTKDGKRHSYNMWRDDAKGPQFEKISSIEKEIPNGVKISIPVRRSDINTFNTKIQEFCQWLPVIPDVKGMDIVKPEIITSVEHDDFVFNFINQKKYKNYVRMAGVLYSIEVDYHKFRKNFVIDCPVGTFQPAPDRETIIMSPTDKQKLSDKLSEVHDKIQKNYENELVKQPTLHRARLFHKNRDSIVPSKNFKWRYSNDSSVSIQERIKTPDNFSKKNTYCSRQFIKVLCHNYRTGGISYSERTGIEPNLLLAVYDTEGFRSNFRNHVSEWMVNNNIPNLRDKCIVVLKGDTPEERMKYWVKLGRPDVPVIKHTEWRPLKAQKNSVSKKTTFSVFTYNNIKSRLVSQSVPVEDNQKRVYIPVNRNCLQITSCGTNVKVDQVWALEHIKSVCGIRENEIILVPKTLWKKIPDSWKNLETHIRNTFDEILASKQFCTYEDKYFFNNYNLKHLDFIENKAIEVLNSFQNLSVISSFNEFEHAMKRKNIKTRRKFSEVKKKITERLYSKYPLLKFVSSNPSEETKEHFKIYKEAVDEKFG